MNENKITIGSDPEFVIMCGNSIANALEIFSKVFEEEILDCMEPEEPDDADISIMYFNNAETYIYDALNNISLEETYRKHALLAAETLIEILKEQRDITKIIAISRKNKNEIDEAIKETIHLKEQQDITKIINILGINKEEIDEAIKERIRLFDYKNYYFKNIPYEIQLLILSTATKNKILHQNINITIYIAKGKHEKFKSRYIAKLMDYFSNATLAGFPLLTELHPAISEFIITDINNNWEYDYDLERSKESHLCHAEIGCDGHSITGEMRPKYGNDPIEHFNEILKLVKRMYELLKSEIVCHGKELKILGGTVHGLKWGDEKILIGGHIHIGYDVLQKVNFDSLLEHMMSVFVGIPLTLIEKPEEIIKRHKAYGRWGDARPKAKPKDDYNGLEFRMPSSWLVSPEITIGALSLAYVVADEFITGYHENKISSSIDLMFDKQLKYSKIYDRMLYEQFEEIDIFYYTQLMSEAKILIYNNIKTMRLYPQYKEYIDYIFNMIENNEHWKSEEDILLTWAGLF